MDLFRSALRSTAVRKRPGRHYRAPLSRNQQRRECGRKQPHATKKPGVHRCTPGSNNQWSGGRDSNPQQSAWKADALPIELPPHGRGDWIRTSDVHRCTPGSNNQWSGGRDSNPQQSAWKADALPIELPPHGRGDWIRTSDVLLPKQVRYQTAPRPERLMFDQPTIKELLQYTT